MNFYYLSASNIFVLGGLELTLGFFGANEEQSNKENY